MTPLPVSVRSDSLAERSEFELPVPVSKLSWDSIMLGFAIETGCEALLPRTAFLARFSFCLRKRRSQNGAASLWNPAAESVAVWRMPEKASLEHCDSSAEPALVFRTIKATRLSVANYNTTLSSESLETGTGGSNSLRSAKQSFSTGPLPGGGSEFGHHHHVNRVLALDPAGQPVCLRRSSAI